MTTTSNTSGLTIPLTQALTGLGGGGGGSPPPMMGGDSSLDTAKTLGALAIVDGSTTRTRTGYITNAAQDEDYVAEVMADDPLGFWKCDESTGSTLANSATKSGGVAESLTIVGSPTLGESLVTGGITYDGIEWDNWPADEYAVVEQSSSWLPTDFPFCLEAAIKMQSAASVYLVSLNCTGPYGQATIRTVNDAIQIITETDSGSITGGGLSGGDFPNGSVIHVFARWVSATERYLYIDGHQERKDTTEITPFGTAAFNSICINGDYNSADPDTHKAYPTSDCGISLVALYNTDISPVRIACHSAAFHKHWDLNLEGSAAAVSAISSHGGLAVESDGSAANHAEIGLPDTPGFGTNYPASIFDDLGERRNNWGQEQDGLAETAYTIVAAVSRDSYSDVDVIIANNAGTSSEGLYGATRDANDGIELSILADDTAQFKHQGTTVVSTETITTDDTVVITARFDTGTMSIFVDGSDKQDQAGAPSNLLSSGMTSIAVDAAQTGGGFDGRIGPVMVFPSALSDAEILDLSDKILNG